MELEKRLNELQRPPKTPDNSSLPPSKRQKPNRTDKAERQGPRKGSLGRKGGGRALTAEPDETVLAKPGRCRHCQAAAVGAGPTSTRGAAVGEALAFHAPGFLELTP